MAKHKIEFECDYDILRKIIRNVNTVTAPDQRSLIIRRAARLAGGIAFRQPFYDGNKETALAFSIRYLNRNGYDLALEDPDIELSIYEQLMKIEFGKGDASAYSELESFISKNIKGKKP